MKKGFREDFNIDNRVVKQEDVKVGEHCYYVSTVDLGIDHGYGGFPLYYETMVFLDGESLYMNRYSTREEALSGHEKTAKKMASEDFSNERGYIEFSD